MRDWEDYITAMNNQWSIGFWRQATNEYQWVPTEKCNKISAPFYPLFEGSSPAGAEWGKIWAVLYCKKLLVKKFKIAYIVITLQINLGPGLI